MKKILLLILPALLSSNTIWAQEILSGIVKDSLGAPLTGAIVVVKGSSSYAIADTAGLFNITTTKQFPVTLKFNATGYKTYELLVNTQPGAPINILLAHNNRLSDVVITSRRRRETAQDVPIPISVLGGPLVADAGAFNVNRLKELVPSVQLYSSNPRNTTLNIRGLGSTFGLTNDGIDPGVGFYVDGVYYARPAATTLDFIDIEQIEVLRGPQGTLFGKNTTAGAFNITTRAASFKPGANFELSYGNYGYVQAKASVTGPITKKLAARFSFSGTQRDGVLTNVATNQKVNDLNNLGARAQLLYKPNKNINITLAGDASRQRPNGYAQVYAGTAPTLRPAYRQFGQIISDLGYTLPSTDPFDRKIDQNTVSKSNNDLGGVSLNIDAKIGGGTLTTTTAFRYWNWDPSSDRDYTGLSVLRLSQAPSKHKQWTQEVRYAGDIISSKLSGLIGTFVIGQDLKTAQVEESGDAQWRFSQSSTSTLWSTPGLLNGYGANTNSTLTSFGAAVFGQLDWTVVKGLHVLPGLRFNYDEKKANFARTTDGGLQTTNASLIALKNGVYANQSFDANVNNSNLSGQLTVAYKATRTINAFAAVSTSYKPIGINLGGLPTTTTGGETKVLTNLAEVKPEYVTHEEIGIKTNPTNNSTLNFVLHNTDIKDFQTQVQTAEVGVNRGYLANAEKVRVFGAELDGEITVGRHLSVYGAATYTDGKYVSFKNAPVPLEETGGANAFKDISGTVLPGISKWAGSLGGELTTGNSSALGHSGKFFLAVEGYYRSSFSSSPSQSAYLNIDGYAILNARLGFRATDGLSFFVWGRNLLNKNYFEQLLVAAGNAGQYGAVLGDPRTYGVTLRYNL